MCDLHIFERFKPGVCQGCIISNKLFNMYKEHIMWKVFAEWRNSRKV